MELLLERTEKTQTYTAGSLYVVNELGKAYFCDTLEPSLHPTNHLRPKAIPAGRYDVAVTWSPRFNNSRSTLERLMQRLKERTAGEVIHLTVE